MDSLGNLAVLVNFWMCGQFGAVTGFKIRWYAARDDHAYAAPGAFCVVRCHALKAVFGLFQSRVHGAHDGAVFDLSESQIQRRKQQGVAVVHSHEFVWHVLVITSQDQ